MKKYLICLLCSLLVPALAMAAVPEDALHEAVLTLTWLDDSGECWVEGHVVLGEEQKGNITEVYAQVFYQNYGFRDGVFTDTGGGSIHPAVLVFENTADGYALKEILEPDDGEDYGPSIDAMMPRECIRKMQEEGGAIRAEMERQMTEQAQSYLDAIGRTEKIQDWRERDLQLSGMMTAASNLMSNVERNYPLWVTSHERVEEGVRYVYAREWAPDGPGAETGIETLRKTRYDDGAVVETITAEVSPEQLRITLEDGGGSITYLFSFDGRNYARPEITAEGECELDTSGIEMDISRLSE